jgi:hypothetical protein
MKYVITTGTGRYFSGINATICVVDDKEFVLSYIIDESDQGDFAFDTICEARTYIEFCEGIVDKLSHVIHNLRIGERE